MKKQKALFVKTGLFLMIVVLASSMTLFGCSFSDDEDQWTGQDDYSYDDSQDDDYAEDDNWSYDGDDEDDVISSDVMEESPIEAEESSTDPGNDQGQNASSGNTEQSGTSAVDSNKKKGTQKSRYKRAKNKLAKLKWKGKPYRIVNKNKPFFTKKQLRKARKSYKKFGRLDKRGRCTYARASLSKQTMPKANEEREDISFVHPSGWKSGQSWERMHLLGWALSDENANPRNLITGTHYCNSVGMLPFEERINSYIRYSGNHVLYRVTPVFRGKELIARGVLMEARSVEDKGRGICFNVFCYNVRDDGSKINYNTGYVKESSLEGDMSRTNKERKYVINMNSGKFHFPSCQGVKEMADHNKRVVKATRRELIKQGYEPCGMCEP
ncbi:MAG: DNA/RNA non-specific endonuclease [Bacillota bacterium]|nr:DNA/RNA non-specific endonuclease [Bacillota bacterium]